MCGCETEKQEQHRGGGRHADFILFTFAQNGDTVREFHVAHERHDSAPPDDQIQEVPDPPPPTPPPSSIQLTISSLKQLEETMFKAERSPPPSTPELFSTHLSVLEPVDDVGADSVEALPAVLGREAGGDGLGRLRGALGDLRGLMGRPPDVSAFPRRGLGGLVLHRFGGGGRLRLSGLALLQGRLGGPGGGLGPGGQEGHLGFVGVFLAHVGAVKLVTLAGVAQLPQVPHDLDEVVARVGGVGPAEVGPALEVAGVGSPLDLDLDLALALDLDLAGALAGDAQACVVPGCGHQHGAGVLGLGAEADGLAPDAFAGLGARRGDGGAEQQQDSYPCSHGDACVRRGGRRPPLYKPSQAHKDAIIQVTGLLAPPPPPSSRARKTHQRECGVFMKSDGGDECEEGGKLSRQGVNGCVGGRVGGVHDDAV